MIQGPASLPELPPLQRACGAARIAVVSDGGRTRLARLYQDGCGKIRLPRAAGSEAVLINTAGGLTGGDRLDWQVDVGARAHLTVTSQACEKVYRALSGQAETRASLSVDEDARLDWLPQETILFDGGAFARTLEVDLAAGARLLAMEAIVLGRTAMVETVRRGALSDRWRIRRQGRLVFADDLRLGGPVAETAARPPVLAGGCAFASLLLVAEDAGRFVQPLRAAIGPMGGASAYAGKLFCRIVARDGFALRRALIPALDVLRDGAPLPRVWSA